MSFTNGTGYTFTTPMTMGSLTSLSTDRVAWSRTIEEMMKYPQTYQAKEPEMTTLEKVRKERQEAIERKQIEAMYADFDELALDLSPDGIVFRFDWDRGEKVYTYAALKANGHWYVTGGSAPNGLATEDFVAWLIGKKIPAVGLVMLEAAS